MSEKTHRYIECNACFKEQRMEERGTMFGGDRVPEAVAMTCKTIDLGGGALAIVCDRGRRPALCDVCKSRPHEVLCDFPLHGAKAGKTCDRKLCRTCAKHVGANKDLCPPHAKLGLPQAELALETK